MTGEIIMAIGGAAMLVGGGLKAFGEAQKNKENNEENENKKED